MSKAKNAEQLEEEDINGIDKQLMMKLSKRKRPENKRSEIDPTRIITKEYWTVSLVRLPDSSHSQHAFLVLKGKSNNKSMIWFIDFVANDEYDLLLPGMRDGKVREDYHESTEVPGSSSKLLFQGRKKMMEVHNSDRLLYSTWQIPKSAAETLMLNIQAQRTNPPKYNILGNSALAASSAASSSNTINHNCFTFARMILHNLNDKYIRVPEDTLDKWIGSAASRFLVDKQFNKSRKTSIFALVLALGFLVGVATAYLIPVKFL